MPSAKAESVGFQPSAVTTATPVKTRKSWSLLDDDVWIMMMASYWRLTAAVERKVREECDGAPDFMCADISREVRDTAYAAERETWARGMDRLCEIYGVPDGSPDVSGAAFEQAALL